MYVSRLFRAVTRLRHGGELNSRPLNRKPNDLNHYTSDPRLSVQNNVAAIRQNNSAVCVSDDGSDNTTIIVIGIPCLAAVIVAIAVLVYCCRVKTNRYVIIQTCTTINNKEAQLSHRDRATHCVG